MLCILLMIVAVPLQRQAGRRMAWPEHICRPNSSMAARLSGPWSRNATQHIWVTTPSAGSFVYLLSIVVPLLSLRTYTFCSWRHAYPYGNICSTHPASACACVCTLGCVVWAGHGDDQGRGVRRHSDDWQGCIPDCILRQ